MTKLLLNDAKLVLSAPETVIIYKFLSTIETLILKSNIILALIQENYKEEFRYEKF
jgi:hypothetical protein